MMKWPNVPFLRERPRLRRNLLRAAAAGVALWFFWYPADRRELYAAIPSDAPVAMYVRNLASEDRALLRHPAVQEMLRDVGEDPEEVLEDNLGLFWTFFGLTGENTVLGLVPNQPPESEEFSLPTDLDGLFDAYSLAGASYTGWKARIIELLWRIRYVPGLGPLRTTDSGTRYMEFPHARELRERGIVLGVDIVDGVLVAVLSREPERVRELAARVRATGRPDAPALAAAFGSEPAPWRGGSLRHDLWLSNPWRLSPDPTVPLHIELASFREPGFRFRSNDPALDPTELPKPSSFDFRAFPPNEAILWATVPNANWTILGPALQGYAIPGAEGCAFAWLAGKPYTGHLSILETPTIGLSVPTPDGWDFNTWWGTAEAQLKTDADPLKPRFDAPSENLRLVRFKNMELFGHTPEADRAFATHADGRLTVGTGYGAYRKLCAAAGTVPTGTAPALLRVHADLPRLADEARNLAGILALANRFGLQLPIPPDGPARIVQGLDLLRALGSVDATLTLSDNQTPVLDIRATGPSLQTNPQNP